MEQFRGTTIVSVRRNGKVAIAGDGQVSMGNTVMKGNARKVRPLAGGNVYSRVRRRYGRRVYPFRTVRDQAGTVRQPHPGSDRAGQRNGAPIVACGALKHCCALRMTEKSFIISGNGDVIEPENDLMAIGSGGPYAQAAALALLRNTDMEARRHRCAGVVHRRRYLRLHQPQHHY